MSNYFFNLDIASIAIICAMQRYNEILLPLVNLSDDRRKSIISSDTFWRIIFEKKYGFIVNPRYRCIPQDFRYLFNKYSSFMYSKNLSTSKLLFPVIGNVIAYSGRVGLVKIGDIIYPFSQEGIGRWKKHKVHVVFHKKLQTIVYLHSYEFDDINYCLRCSRRGNVYVSKNKSRKMNRDHINLREYIPL